MTFIKTFFIALVVLIVVMIGISSISTSFLDEYGIEMSENGNYSRLQEELNNISITTQEKSEEWRDTLSPDEDTGSAEYTVKAFTSGTSTMIGMLGFVGNIENVFNYGLDAIGAPSWLSAGLIFALLLAILVLAVILIVLRSGLI